jgi:UDP-N-acetylglucosamine:LPS N-acetylglucosamine transferase
LGEYGNTLAWRYVFWDVFDGFISPLEQAALTYPFPAGVSFVQIDLPARMEFYELADAPSGRNSALVICGYWGQGPIPDLVRRLLTVCRTLEVHVVCGENRALEEKTQREFAGRPAVRVHGVVDHLKPLLSDCGCVITKPGISTLLEAHAARRKIFLLKGMPVAEDNNARYAIAHFGAEWFGSQRFQEWHAGQAGMAVSSS